MGTALRGLHSDITTELAKGSYSFAHLVTLSLNTTYYYTDAPNNISEGGNTFQANGFLGIMNSVTETSSITTGSFTLAISAVDQTIIQDILANGYIHKGVTIKRAFLDASNNLISSNAVFTVYSGNIEGMVITDTERNSVLNLQVANQWAFFARKAGRRTTVNSQNQFYADDIGFKWMAGVNK